MAADMNTDVLIIGGGPGGAATALRLLDLGIRPLIVEREQFPRYHIGESMTGECGGLVRNLGFGDRMAKAGYPVKHGVNVFGTRGGNDWFVPVMQRTPEGLKDQFTWQVRRSEFDTMMLDEAVGRGADLVLGKAVAPLMNEDGSVVRGARVRTEDGSAIDVKAEMTLDCSGQASFLANQKVTGPKYLGAYDKQIAIFSQVANYVRDNGTERADQPGNTHIFYKKKYHWAWAIPTDGETTSVGIVIPAQYFRDKKESRADFVSREICELNPGLRERIPDPVVLTESPHVVPNYSFQVRKFAGPGYICVGDSHRFIDPIFSFGLFVAIKEAGIAAQATARWLEGEGRGSDDPFQDYMIYVERGIDMLEDLVDTFWENPLAFSVFVHQRYREGVVDIFAGRNYDGDGLPTDDRDEAVGAMRKLLKRERTYDHDGLYSVPIGSRFHPERAPLWNSELDSVETTERWMRELV